MYRVLLSLLVFVCYHKHGLQAQDPIGEQPPFLIHPDLISEDFYADVVHADDETPAEDDDRDSGSPLTADHNPDDVAMFCPSGCTCTGKALNPTALCSGINLTDIPDNLSRLIVHL